MGVPRSSINQNIGELRRKTCQLWKLIWKQKTIIDDRLMISVFNNYSVFNTVLLCLMLSAMSKLYQKTVIFFENGFCACYVAFSVCGLWTADRGADIKLWTAYEILKKMVLDSLMTGSGEFALVFVKLKWFRYLYGGWMFSESVLVGLPFPSRQSWFPRTSTIVQFIFYFWSFEISVNILRNRK